MAWLHWVLVVASPFVLACGPSLSDESGGGTSTDDSGSDESGSSHPTDCEQAATRAECEAIPAGAVGRPSCAWAEVQDVADAQSCELTHPVGVCVPTTYQGEGCVVGPTCGQWEHPRIYVRVVDGDQQIFSGQFCETYPEGWTECAWADLGNGDFRAPDDPACGCLCPPVVEDPPPATCADATSEEQCEAVAGDGGSSCGWVDTYVVRDTLSCELEAGPPQCVSASYVGDGCGASTACGTGESPKIYYQNDGDTVRLFQRDFCETQPDDWTECQWGPEGAADPSVLGDPACDCLCG